MLSMHKIKRKRIDQTWRTRLVSGIIFMIGHNVKKNLFKSQKVDLIAL